MPIAAPAPAVVELALHALAFAPMPEPGSLFDPRYVAWCRGQLPSAAWQVLADDAPLLAALAACAGPAWWSLQGLAFAHRDLSALVAAGARPLDARDRADAPQPAAGTALRELASAHESLVEVARADAALVARAYAEAHRTVIAPALAVALDDARPALAAAAARVPSLARVPVLLSFTLGPRGRSFGETLVVGAPSAWSPLPASRPAVLAVHERAVSLAARLAAGDPHTRWARSEAAALRAVALHLADSPLASDWERWRETVDASGLEDAADAKDVAAVRAALGAP